MQCYKHGTLPLISPELHCFRDKIKAKEITNKEFFNYQFLNDKNRIQKSIEEMKNSVLPKDLYRGSSPQNFRNSDLRKIRSDSMQYALYQHKATHREVASTRRTANITHIA